VTVSGDALAETFFVILAVVLFLSLFVPLGRPARRRSVGLRGRGLPVFVVEEVRREGGKILLRGKGSRRRWIGERFIAYLEAGPGIWIEGHFRDIEGRGRRATLVLPDRDPAGELAVGRAYPYLDGYWGERAVLVLDESRIWREVEFAPRRPWDHDHCRVCWAVISDRENTLHRACASGEAVCPRCHDRYVVRRSLDFVERV
jgi:hypothetical protein